MEHAQVLTFLNNKDRDLLLQFCGYSTTEPLHSFGPVVRPHYIIHFILNRKGIFQIHALYCMKGKLRKIKCLHTLSQMNLLFINPMHKSLGSIYGLDLMEIYVSFEISKAEESFWNCS